MVTSVASMKIFSETNENPIEDKNGAKREILPYQWDEVAYHVLKYISCECKLSVVYGYHFRLLCEIRFTEDFPSHQGMNIPQFLLQSIRDMRQMCREGKYQHLAHHGLIKLIVEDALKNLKIPMLWCSFIDMDRETLTVTHTVTPRDISDSILGYMDTKT